MNKLVIIGNGFDLAHGLKTSYKDFILWEINEAFKQKSRHLENALFVIESPYFDLEMANSVPFQFKTISEYFDFLDKHAHQKVEPIYTYPFIKSIFEFSKENWVDIEREYFIKLVDINFLPIGEKLRLERVSELNNSIDLIKTEFEKYLLGISSDNYFVDEIDELLESDIILNSQYEIHVLNFNYTDTIETYISRSLIENKAVDSINYIHGKLADKNNPIIFGYGDETDKNYEKIEELYENKYLKHMKSFAYLQTPNYKNLFEFLDKKDEPFEVHIMGHSCGLSDRLLFTHILEHPNLHSVKIYYYEREDGTNDFFEKTQELSRYFRKDEKHKMRKVIVPFNESVPLVKYKPNQQN